LQPGPQIGQLTKAVYELQLDGKITTLDEAIAAAAEIIKGKSQQKADDTDAAD
jgi:hypothetical protein